MTKDRPAYNSACMAAGESSSVSALRDLVPCLERTEGFVEVVSALRAGQSATIDGAWGSSRALTCAALAKNAAGPVVIVLPRIGDVDDFALDLAGFLGGDPLVFPAWETLPDEHSVADAVFGGRLRVIGSLERARDKQGADGPLPPQSRGERESDTSTFNPQPSTFPVIVTSIPALLQPVPSRDERARGSRVLRVGDELDVEELLRWLVERGFQRAPAIETPGEFSMHGGILDVFPPDAVDPLRIELFGDEIESIRTFDVETQRKVSDLDDVTLTVIAPGAPGASRDGESFLDSLPAGSWVVLSELQELRDEGKQYLERLDQPRGLYSVPAVLERCTRFPTVVVASLTSEGYEQHCHLAVESVERFSGPRNEVLKELANTVGKTEWVLIVCHNEGERHRLQQLLTEADAPIGRGVSLCLGFLARGFRLVRDRIVVLSDHELFHRTEIRRTARKQRAADSRAIDSFLELAEGDLVVHLSHGIGRFLGMRLMTEGDQAEEHLVLEFRDGVKIYVPVSLIHLVQKYVGAAKGAPELSKIGGTSWAKKKQQVADAVTDMAADMLRMQAVRAGREGFACPPDGDWMRDFEAAFPYVETPDQATSIRDVKRDLEMTKPMDRLICGDVGYGKTEVAMRGAFKAIEAGRQVAVLVPTTILAEQHFRTFSERMAEFPIQVEVLSRFRTKKEQKRILERMANGDVDVVIGTHRLVQRDVVFHNLGLIIIDEEQRFGVEAKDRLKQLRTEVDVLTLSATPIPRTLHMSILGIRDISNLTTPPQDRQAIETRLSRFDPQLIRNAIVRELNRGGQVYFVHNRVHDIQKVADRLQQIVPEARIVIGHGQMSPDELEEAMVRFVTGRADILVATTIIESGLDIPNANTMFIHRADIYGLADMHQLRGRVGRHKNRAYCYLLLEEGRMVSEQAAKRLKAIEEFSELGAGFRIAMRDLEIRGAGNILGTEQSGHIASVGYELYCQLLDNAVRKLKNEPVREYRHVQVELPLPAYFPNSWIPPGRHKIETYRRLSSCRSLSEVTDLRTELTDRFGPAPAEGARLLDVRELQCLANEWRVEEIRPEDGFVVFRYRDAARIRKLQKRLGTRLRIVDEKSAYYVPAASLEDGDALLAELKSVLQSS